MPRTRLPIVQIGAVRGPLAALACLGLVLAAVSGCSSASAAPKNPLAGTCLSGARGARCACFGLVLGPVSGYSPASAAPKNPLAGTCLSGASVPLTIVVGERSNVPSIQFPSAVTSLLNTAATDREPVTLIRIDGKPKVFPVAPFSTSDVSSGAIQQDIRNYVNGVIQILTGSHLHAAAPQADVLGALSLAAEATPAGGNIVVIDSGLQTAGQLMYQNPGVLMSPPSDVVKFLRAGNLIPRLSGRHVLLYGFGYTAAPQAALDQPERENVAAQWKAIVAAGGACVTVNTTPHTKPEMAGLQI